MCLIIHTNDTIAQCSTHAHVQLLHPVRAYVAKWPRNSLVCLPPFPAWTDP